jgi:stage II sporulation protein AA (anti-sigma F factor antagonist)
MITHASLMPELDCELVAFYGELDAAAAPDLMTRLEAVTEPPAACLLIDLCGCSFIDSLGIATLVAGVRAMIDRGRRAVVACDHPNVRRTMEQTGLDEVVEVYWTRDEAVSALTAEAR